MNTIDWVFLVPLAQIFLQKKQDFSDLSAFVCVQKWTQSCSLFIFIQISDIIPWRLMIQLFLLYLRKIKRFYILIYVLVVLVNCLRFAQTANYSLHLSLISQFITENYDIVLLQYLFSGFLNIVNMFFSVFFHFFIWFSNSLQQFPLVSTGF